MRVNRDSRRGEGIVLCIWKVRSIGRRVNLEEMGNHGEYNE
jgi:hypothetical protein